MLLRTSRLGNIKSMLIKKQKFNNVKPQVKKALKKEGSPVANGVVRLLWGAEGATEAIGLVTGKGRGSQLAALASLYILAVAPARLASCYKDLIALTFLSFYLAIKSAFFSYKLPLYISKQNTLHNKVELC